MSSFRTRYRGVLLCLLALGAVATAAQAENHVVNIVGNEFQPSVLEVAGGDSVTWINDGGLNNVVALDGSFDSGPPSTDLWQFTHTFHVGGTYDYVSEPQAGMTGNVDVLGVFGDGYESGGVEAWDYDAPVLPACHCYFSSDCAGNTFCDWGNLTQEDTCEWMENKPDGVPGAGCDVLYLGEPWIAGICDGTCEPSAAGSSMGFESRANLETAVRLWAEAMLRPAVAGGGPVDPEIAAKAEAVPFTRSDVTWNVGRNVADILAMVVNAEFAPNFCHHEGHPEDPAGSPTVDLAGDTCGPAAARLAVEALLADMENPGSGAALIALIPNACPGWTTMFSRPCGAGEAGLACVRDRVREAARFISTPKGGASRTQPAS